MQHLRTQIRRDPPVGHKERLELSGQTRLRLSYSRPIKVRHRQATDTTAPTRMRIMAYDEPSGWFESLDPEHCLSRAAPLSVEMLSDPGMFC